MITYISLKALPCSLFILLLSDLLWFIHIRGQYFIGRNCCGKKMFRGKSRNFRDFFLRNNIIFRNSHLFLPTTYTLRVLIDVPPIINFLIFFAPPISPAPYSNPPPRLLSIWVNSIPPVYSLPPPPLSPVY